MPYAKWEDVNAAIHGIKPRVTLAMANHIADVADGITRSKSADNPWAAAIAAFKREYKVMGGRWVKRKPKAEAGAMTAATKAAMMTELDRDLLYVYEAEKLAAEAATKAVGGRRLMMDDFLVHEDPEKPTTWHLPVKINGKANRKLAAGAWAALMSPGGHRGKKYEGPDASKAKADLKAMYKDQGWDMPMTEAAADADTPTPDEAAEDRAWYPQADSGGIDWSEVPSVPYMAKSFADVAQSQQARKATEQLHVITYQFGELARNIVGDHEETDKMGALRGLTEEFLGIAERVLGNVMEPTPAVEVEAGEAATKVRIGETHAGAVMGWAELAEGDAPAAVPMTMEVQLIEPGWGNTRDNNYYPADMLARDAKVFEGAKMFETDHRPGEKSNRTWVSTVTKINRFSPTGAPIAEVVVHDPGFAERTRALKAADLLNRMECSILAGGMSRKGKVDGRPGNVVEQITEAMAVDWVTRAGAGGHAVGLAEDAEKGDTMKRNMTVRLTGGKDEADPEVLKTKLQAQAMELFGEGTKVELVEMAEDKPTPAAPAAAPEPAKVEPVFLAEAEVKAAVEATSLPAPSKARLAAGKFADAPALQAAISSETDYVKALTGAGSPFAQGPSQAAGDHPMTDEEYDKGLRGIAERYGVPQMAKAAAPAAK